MINTSQVQRPAITILKFHPDGSKLELHADGDTEIKPLKDASKYKKLAEFMAEVSNRHLELKSTYTLAPFEASTVTSKSGSTNMPFLSYKVFTFDCSIDSETIKELEAVNRKILECIYRLDGNKQGHLFEPSQEVMDVDISHLKDLCDDHVRKNPNHHLNTPINITSQHHSRPIKVHGVINSPNVKPDGHDSPPEERSYMFAGCNIPNSTISVLEIMSDSASKKTQNLTIKDTNQLRSLWAELSASLYFIGVTKEVGTTAHAQKQKQLIAFRQWQEPKGSLL